MRFVDRSSTKLIVLCIAGFAAQACGLRAEAQGPGVEWQAEVRKLAEQQKWEAAVRVVDGELERSPGNLEARVWRARILTWSGELPRAEKEYEDLVALSPNDPDNWAGLATVYAREERWDDALRTSSRAVEIDPRRADLRIAKGRILRSKGERKEARTDFQKALDLEPGNAEARAGLSSLQEEAKHTLQIGQDNDLFNFTDGNHAEWLRLSSSWTPSWGTSAGTGFYQRGGLSAQKYEGSITGRLADWAAITVGGAGARDNGAIPAGEAYFDVDRGWNFGKTGFVRGLELAYGQHWYWYSTARILTLNQTSVVYLPNEWTWTLRVTGARSHFSGTGIDWKPSGQSRVDFPVANWKGRTLSGNVFYAVGTEDFARVDQIGSFASQNYGGGLRFRPTTRHEISAYGFYQKRTQDRTQTSFGFSYAFHF